MNVQEELAGNFACYQSFFIFFSFLIFFYIQLCYLAIFLPAFVSNRFLLLLFFCLSPDTRLLFCLFPAKQPYINPSDIFSFSLCVFHINQCHSRWSYAAALCGSSSARKKNGKFQLSFLHYFCAAACHFGCVCVYIYFCVRLCTTSTSKSMIDHFCLVKVSHSLLSPALVRQKIQISNKRKAIKIRIKSLYTK